MKKMILISLLAALRSAAAGQTVPAAAQQVALRQAVAMHDSLYLTVLQQDSLYACNIRLYRMKSSARQYYAGSTESVRAAVQKVENMRDSLYMGILQPDRYQMYLRKKIGILRQ